MAQAKQNSYAACICFVTPVLEQQNICGGVNTWVF